MLQWSYFCLCVDYCSAVLEGSELQVQCVALSCSRYVLDTSVTQVRCSRLWTQLKCLVRSYMNAVCYLPDSMNYHWLHLLLSVRCHGILNLLPSLIVFSAHLNQLEHSVHYAFWSMICKIFCPMTFDPQMANGDQDDNQLWPWVVCQIWS